MLSCVERWKYKMMRTALLFLFVGGGCQGVEGRGGLIEKTCLLQESVISCTWSSCEEMVLDQLSSDLWGWRRLCTLPQRGRGRRGRCWSSGTDCPCCRCIRWCEAAAEAGAQTPEHRQRLDLGFTRDISHHEGFSQGQCSSHHLQLFNAGHWANRHWVRVLHLVHLVQVFGVGQGDHQGQMLESFLQAFYPFPPALQGFKEDDQEVEEERSKHPEDSEKSPHRVDQTCNMFYSVNTEYRGIFSECAKLLAYCFETSSYRV